MARGAVISGATRGRGGVALARHLADRRRERQNEQTRLGATRGVLAQDIEKAIDELTRIVSHARSRQPLYHVHLDPEVPWVQAQRDRYWCLFEAEFGFQRQPFVEAVHVKHEREHYHRVYSRVRSDGTVIPLSHDYARREKIGRQIEFELGGRHLVGGHNWAVARALVADGRLDVARSIAAAGLLTADRPMAAMTPKQRHQAARTGIDPRDIRAIVLKVWNESTTEALLSSLALEGLQLCAGDKVPVLRDLAGGVHSLTRVLGEASKAAGRRIPAAEVKARIAHLHLPQLSETGEHDDDTNEDVPGLDVDDHAGLAQKGPSPRPAGDSEGSGAARRRARIGPQRRRHAPHVRKLGAYEAATGSVAHAPSRRADQSRKDSGPFGGHFQVQSADFESAGGTRRSIGRTRTADHRIECLLDEPEFQQELDRIAVLTEKFDPMHSRARQLEDWRAELMLGDLAFANHLEIIDQFMAVLVLAVAWLLEKLFRHSPVTVPEEDDSPRPGSELEIGTIPTMNL